MMEFVLKPKNGSLTLRMGLLFLLVCGGPFAIKGMYEEVSKVGIWFFSAISLLLIWEFARKLFGMPFKVVVLEETVRFSYFLRKTKELRWSDILGYSHTLDATRYGWNKGIMIYPKNGNSVSISEINIHDIPILAQHLEIKGLIFYGEEKLWPGISGKYKKRH